MENNIRPVLISVVYSYMSKMITQYESLYVPNKDEIISIEIGNETLKLYILNKTTIIKPVTNETYVTLFVRDN